MNILQIKIAGFGNIGNIELNLGKFNALIALNNYGKSNVIKAIRFAFDFITEPLATKKRMMGYIPAIPINKHIADKPFEFEISFETKVEKDIQTINYGFTFDWAKNEKSRGQKIRNEFLKVKSDLKYKSYLNRDSNQTLYLSSPTGRCDKKLLVEKNELAINKLSNYDDLFYLEVVKILNNLKLELVDTLQDPDQLFRMVDTKEIVEDYSLEMPNPARVGFFIYSLKKRKPELYDIFKDSVKSLLPSIEDFSPQELNLKKELKLKGTEGPIPMDFPERFYDIQVKEINNNQQTNIKKLSSGSQKIFYVLALTIAADLNRIPLVLYEEIENSIHPGLLQKLLLVLDNLADNTKIILTSHSPYLIQYLDVEKIKIGVPNQKGLAIFKEVKKTKFNRAIKIAEDQGISVGDLIFDCMIEAAAGESELLSELCA